MLDTWSRRVALLAVLIVLVLLPGCNGDDSPTEPPLTDAVAIQNIVPASGTVVRRGTQVTFTVVVRYSLGSASEGRLVLVIQDQNNQKSPARSH